jgi:hypothetical protein
VGAADAREREPRDEPRKWPLAPVALFTLAVLASLCVALHRGRIVSLLSGEGGAVVDKALLGSGKRMRRGRGGRFAAGSGRDAAAAVPPAGAAPPAPPASMPAWRSEMLGWWSQPDEPGCGRDDANAAAPTAAAPPAAAPPPTAPPPAAAAAAPPASAPPPAAAAAAATAAAAPPRRRRLTACCTRCSGAGRWRFSRGARAPAGAISSSSGSTRRPYASATWTMRDGRRADPAGRRGAGTLRFSPFE